MSEETKTMYAVNVNPFRNDPFVRPVQAIEKPNTWRVPITSNYSKRYDKDATGVGVRLFVSEHEAYCALCEHLSAKIGYIEQNLKHEKQKLEIVAQLRDKGLPND